MKSSKAKALGYRLKMIRASKNVKQKDLAEKLSVSQAYVSDLEAGKRMIPSDTLFQLAEIFDIGLESFDIRKELAEEKDFKKEFLDMKKKIEDHFFEQKCIRKDITELKKGIEQIKILIETLK